MFLSDGPVQALVSVIRLGMDKVGNGMATGIYVGRPEEEGFCDWNRLYDLYTVTEDTIAVAPHQSFFHVENLARDISFFTNCELSPLESNPREPTS